MTLHDKAFYGRLRRAARRTMVLLMMCALAAMGASASGTGGVTGFLDDAFDSLKTVVTGVGAALAVWGVINLLEGYGADNPGARSSGIKQLGGGVGIILVGQALIPQLKTLFPVTVT